MADKKPTVGIVLPVLNERPIIRDSLSHLLSLGADELIVVDGASSDGTDEAVRETFPGVTYARTSHADRAAQMNRGVAQTSSDVLLFAHADMRLPRGAVGHIRRCIRKGYVGGGFTKRYEPSNIRLRMYAFFLNIVYLYMTRSFVGTNGMFVTRDVFRRMGGFVENSFMEDVLFSDRLKREGRLAVIGDSLRVSPRRYVSQGIARQILRNAEVLFRYRCLHQSPSELRKIYGR